MITIRRSQDRGHAHHGWLEARHSFSFADFHDPDFMGFSVLRVINQDTIAPGKGFATHGHRDMEIVTYVLDGVLEHKDSMGNGSQIRPGEVQLMSAGTGVQHSEFNGSPTEPLNLFQIWMLPAQGGTRPRYEQREYPKKERSGRLRLVASPDGREDSLTIGQDVAMYASILGAGVQVEHSVVPGRCVWIQVATGEITVNGQDLGPGDGAAIREEELLVITAGRDCEFLLFDLP
jgi:redox-sensitive bicupin YhaK (pirin superfamily)